MLMLILMQVMVDNNFFDEWTRVLGACILHMFLADVFILVIMGTEDNAWRSDARDSYPRYRMMIVDYGQLFLFAGRPVDWAATSRPSWVAVTGYGKLVAVCVYRPTPRLDLYLDGRSALFISCRISHVLERVTGLGPLYSLNSGDTVATGARQESLGSYSVHWVLINNRLKDVASKI